jgi:AcrR family transcriptional regulator
MWAGKGESMYRGKNRTACTSQKQIAEAMLELLDDCSFQSISVSSICRRADISRQTFYSLFESKENVILYELSESCSFQPDAGCGSALTLQQLAHNYSSYLTEHKVFLTKLVNNGIIHYMYDQQYRSLIECDCFMADSSREDRFFTADFLASGMTSIARSYILSGADEDEAYLENMICSLFSGKMIR